MSRARCICGRVWQRCCSWVSLQQFRSRYIDLFWSECTGQFVASETLQLDADHYIFALHAGPPDSSVQCVMVEAPALHNCGERAPLDPTGDNTARRAALAVLLQGRTICRLTPKP